MWVTLYDGWVCLRVGNLHSHLKRKETLCCKGFAFGFWSTFGAVCISILGEVQICIFGFASFVVICLVHSFTAFVVHFFRRSSQLFCTAHVCSAGPSLFRHFFVSFQFVEWTLQNVYFDFHAFCNNLCLSSWSRFVLLSRWPNRIVKAVWPENMVFCLSRIWNPHLWWLNSPHLLGFHAASPVEFPPEEDLQQEVKSLAAPSWQQPEVGKTWSGTNGSWFGDSMYNQDNNGAIMIWSTVVDFRAMDFRQAHEDFRSCPLILLAFCP